jgi:hypothetical protein
VKEVGNREKQKGKTRRERRLPRDPEQSRRACRSAALISLAFCTIVLNSWVTASWGTELYIPPLTAKSGQTVDIPLMIDEIDNLAGVKIVMTYDPQILIFKEGVKSKETNALMHVVNDKKPGLLIVVMAGARGIKGKAFSIMTLTFTIKEGLKGNHSTQISITEVQLMSDELKDIQCKSVVHPLTILPQTDP